MEKPENQKLHHQLPILFRLTRRCVFFFLLLLVSNIMFYIAGNYQLFLDSSQIQILLIGTISSLVLSFFSLCAVAESIFYVFKNFGKKRIFFIVHAVIMIVIALISIATAVLARSIILVSGGF